MLAGIVAASIPLQSVAETAALQAIKCPYASSDIPDTHEAACHAMSWRDGGIDFRTTVATISPSGEPSKPKPIIYIPGGPGDAPVNEDGDIASILALFPGRSVVTLNPRGVKGAEPRPICEFDEEFWHEELSPEREDAIALGCRDAVTLDLQRFDAPYLARDISAMVTALEIQRAGVFSISYGTESALHLLAEKPDWLDSVILDSVSLPGALGSLDRLKARDRFLGVIDRLCFAEKGCPDTITDKHSDLTAWVTQFDKAPVEVELGPNDEPWSLDGQDMLDFLASMASYPDGAGYGPVFIEAFEASPEDTGPWIDSEMEAGFEYALNNFALLYGAFGDSAERHNPVPTTADTIYPFKVDEHRDFARLLLKWNRENRTEARFIGPKTRRNPAGIPVLVMSGGVDTLTPLSWALELHDRFSGLTHFVFPELAHATAFGTDADVTDEEIATQLNCGPVVVRAFVSGSDFGECEQYLRKDENE